jgi:hypothetical protein
MFDSYIFRTAKVLRSAILAAATAIMFQLSNNRTYVTSFSAALYKEKGHCVEVHLSVSDTVSASKPADRLFKISNWKLSLTAGNSDFRPY